MTEQQSRDIEPCQDLQETWSEICESLRAEIGEASYQSWIKPMRLIGQNGSAVRTGVPTRFMREWIQAHYQDRLSELLDGRGLSGGLDVVIHQEHAASGRAETKPAEARKEDAAPAGPVNGTGIGNGPHADDIGAPLDQRYTFDRFVVGKPNEFAYAAARRVAEAEVVPFNPLFLYGGVGLGKTHLMHAIAWHLRKTRPDRSVIYLSAEKFMYRFVRALREHNTVDFKEQFRSVDVLMVDDVQFISGKESTQEEFFHTFNALVDQGRQIVISADKSPNDLEGMEERLISRLNCGLVADIHATTYELRLGILQAKGEQMGVEVPLKVMEFLAHKITSNVRELEGALNRVVAHHQLVGRDITLETSQDVLHDLLKASERRVTIEEIQKRVSTHFNIRADVPFAPGNRAQIRRPRPHHGDACGEEGGRTARVGFQLQRGC
jgi:chromosomal replication initiator protein